MRTMVSACLLVSLLVALIGDPREVFAQDPAHTMAAHHAGQIELTVANNGTLGSEVSPSEPVDFFTGDSLESCLYPKDSSLSFLFGGSIWIGGVLNGDTLVSIGWDGWSAVSCELLPGPAPGGYLIRRSTLGPDSLDAVSEEDLIAVYSDTTTDGIEPDYFGRPHTPMNIKVTQSSYAWSDTFEEDFVLIRYEIENIGTERLEQAYVGFMIDSDVGHLSQVTPATDDMFGFMTGTSFEFNGCEFADTINLAWIADNDGDPQMGGWTEQSCRHVTGISLVQAPINDPQVSYNWWVSSGVLELDFGPRRHENDRDFLTGGTGTPEGDVNKYFLMSNGEVDYDQFFTASIAADDSVWMYPPQTIAEAISVGNDVRYLMSVGPFDLQAGELIPITIAYIGGKDLHGDPANLDWLPDDPEQYRSHLDFSDLAHSARWAHWTYDNPGVDTDLDGYYGEFVVCDGDTLWVRGDGIPDFKDPVIIDLSTDNLVFTMPSSASQLPDPQIIKITSPYDPGDQQWEMTILDGRWLMADKYSGSYPEQIEISVVDPPVSAGTYNALLKFRDPAAQNSPVYVNVVLFIEAGVNVGDVVALPGSQLSLPINLYSPTPVGRFTIPLRLHTSQPDLIRIDSVVLDPIIGGGAVIRPDDSTVVIRRDIQEPPLPDPDSNYTHVASMYISVDLTASEEIFTVDTTTVFYDATEYVYELEFLDKNASEPGFDFGRVMVGGGCCKLRGDIYHDELGPDMADLVYLLGYMFQDGPPPSCLSDRGYAAEADVDGTGGPIDIADLIYLVNYLFQDGPPPLPCP